MRQIQKWHRAFLRYFPVRTGRLLDVGCGDGAFLAVASEQGFVTSGVEFNAKAVHAAIATRRLSSVHEMSLDEFSRHRHDVTGDTFDVVTFFEVLEHQSDPRQFVASIREILKPGGWIAGSVPNRRRFMLKREQSDYPPHHYLYWSPESLEAFLTREGFVDVCVKQHAGITDSAAYLEVQLLQDVGAWLRTRAKAAYLRDDRAIAESVSVETVRRLTGRRALGLRLLRGARVVVWLLPTLALYPWIRSQLYFHARLADGGVR
jgi:SAM-dependent methyltransferase